MYKIMVIAVYVDLPRSPSITSGVSLVIVFARLIVLIVPIMSLARLSGCHSSLVVSSS